jgi:hypothetical protein
MVFNFGSTFSSITKPFNPISYIPFPGSSSGSRSSSSSRPPTRSRPTSYLGFGSSSPARSSSRFNPITTITS